jgi:hypothetical protein
MNDQEWLLQQLDQWQPSEIEQSEIAIRAALVSKEHQALGARLRRGLASGPQRPINLPLAPPR